MQEKSRLTRRRLLSGMATIGSVGAVSGAGAVGLFSDEAVFTGNLLTAGELDLEVCWGENGGQCMPRDGPVTLDFGSVEKGDGGVATIQCNIADNPGWTWLRTNCPDGPCGIQRGVTVSLWYDRDCDGEIDDEESYVSVSVDERFRRPVRRQLSDAIDDLSSPIEIDDLPLCDALAVLHFGTLLDPDQETDSPDPMEPGGWCCLGFEWQVEEYICLEDSFELEFEFYTQQWRHNPEPTNPWPEPTVCEVDCTEECRDCSPKQGISFVAFCIEDGEIQEGDIRFLPYYDVEGEVYKIEWVSDEPLDWVVLFYGSNTGKYFENFEVDGATSGVVHVNAEEHTPDDEDFHSKLEWKGGPGSTSLGQCPRDPCPDLTNTDFGCGVRYNFETEDGLEAGEWDSVCGQACAGEDGDGVGGGGG